MYSICIAYLLAAPQCFRVVNQGISLSPLHPNISMHIPHTVLHTFPKVQTRRFFFKIKSLFRWWSFPLFLKPSCVIWGWFVKRNWMQITLRDQMVKSLFFCFCFNFFFCRNGTAYLILVRIGLQYMKGWLGAILLKMTQLSCIAIAWQYFFAAWFKWIYHKNLPQESTKSLFFS